MADRIVVLTEEEWHRAIFKLLPAQKDRPLVAKLTRAPTTGEAAERMVEGYFSNNGSGTRHDRMRRALAALSPTEGTSHGDQ